jgi:SAM-dependent methyltransferase
VFDVATSSFGTMFFDDPIAAFRNIGVGVRPGGSLALLAWRALHENEWLMALRGALAVGRVLPEPPPDAPTPFSFADPDRVCRILESAGFSGVELVAIDEAVDLGVDSHDALEFSKSMGIVEGLTEGLAPEARSEATANLAELFRDRETPDGVLFGSASWLITADAG